MRRGDIRLVEFDPARRAEVNRTRPAVIVSNDSANAAATRNGRGVITVLPLTSNTTRIYRFQVLLPARECGLDRDSKAQTEQVRALDVSRIGHFIGTVPADLMADIDAALRLHLTV